MAGTRLTFQSALRYGVIIGRPNRFIMTVDLDGNEIKAHCPATGRIGGLVFKDIVSFSPGHC